ncbi:MAG: hypothetical protein KGM47_17505 [Acidobacteriota bacterium]|nr:hypothetical protein [Acidobacteriota bacterium]
MKTSLAQNRALFLLTDAGATHTRSVVADSSGKILSSARGGPGNAFAVGKEEAWRNLRRSACDVLAAAGAPARKIDAVAVGSASVDFTGKGSAPLIVGLRRLFPRALVRVEADALIALEGALCGKPGVVIVSGTGSIIHAKGPAGKVVRIGGWGPLLGDEGSGQWVGREALHAAARAFDGTGPLTSLLRRLCRHFAISSFGQILDVVYDHPMTPAELGRIAPLAAAAARRGDAVAIEIFKRGAEALALQASKAIRRSGLKRAAVSYQGSVFSVGPLMTDPLRKAILRLAPRSRLIAPLLPPLGGAFLLAMAAVGRTPDPSAIANFRRNCRE